MRLNFVRTLIAAAFVASVAVAAPVAVAPAQASIYDSNVVGGLKLKGKQRSQVQRIVNSSRAQRNRVFRKYGINANAKPNIDKLQRASRELQAIGTRERAQLSRILTPTQMHQYDAIVAQTRARVTRAAF